MNTSIMHLEIEKLLVEILKRYPSRTDAFIPFLLLLQERDCFLSLGDIRGLAEVFGMEFEEMLEVAESYALLGSGPRSTVIRLCQGLSCTPQGAPILREIIETELGIRNGETTEDGKYLLCLMQCLGLCGQGPNMEIDDATYTGLTPKKLREILGLPNHP